MKRKILGILFVLMLVLSFSLVPAVPAMAEGPSTTYYVATTGSDTFGDGTGTWVDTDSSLSWTLGDTGPWLTIQYAIGSAHPGDTILVAAGTYLETLNLLDKGLTLDGAGVDATIVDASFATGYAVQNFGDGATISDLTLIGTGAGSSSYGFKVSHVSDITFERVKVENSYKTALDLNTVDTAMLTDIEAVDTISGFGLMILDSTAVNVNNIATRGNAWGGVSVQTKGGPTDLITFSGTFDVEEDVPLLLEKDPPTYFPITHVTIPSIFSHVVYAFRAPDNYQQFFYRPGLLEAEGFAQSLMVSPAYSNILIYDIAEENYYVIEEMLIQDAIAVATPGDTVNVAAGTYDEQVVINKSLTLQGAGDTTIIKPSSAAKLTYLCDGLWWYDTNNKQIAGIIVANVIGGSPVTVKNLKVDESLVTTKPAGADYLAGIFYRETGGLVDTVTVVGTGQWAPGRAYGMWLSAATNAVSVEIKGSTITNFDKNGIEAHGNTLTANIHHNMITGRGATLDGDEVQNGVSVGREAAATVNYNTISNLAYQPEQWWSAGIMFYSYVSPTGKSATAIGNNITNCQIGIIFKNVNGSAQGNTVSGGTVGLIGIYAEPNASGAWTASFVGNAVSGAKDDSYYGDENAAIGANTYDSVSAGASLTVTIDNNQLPGGGATDADGISIGVEGATGSIVATIRNNTISGWQYGIRLDGANVNATDSSAHLNNISLNIEYGVYNGGSGTLDATNNWWGNASGPDGTQGSPGPTYTGVLPGNGDKVSANVQCMPWLTRPFATVVQDNIAYFGISSYVGTGWNIVSAPLALDKNVKVTVALSTGGAVTYTANTWGGLLNLGKKAMGDDYALKLYYTVNVTTGVRDYTPIYYYDSNPASPNFGWRQATVNTVVNPIDAFYIRMMTADSIPILFSPDLSVPSKKLYQGWNLVGMAYMSFIAAAGGTDDQPIGTALATIYKVSSAAGDVTGYTEVVSPPVNQPSWVYIPSSISSGTYIPAGANGLIMIGRGYWVFMENPGTLAGLTFTPISLLH